MAHHCVATQIHKEVNTLKTKSNPTRVIALASDKLAVGVLCSLVEEGAGLTKRPRNFSTNGSDQSWTVEINYGPNYQYTVSVEAAIVTSKILPPADWLITSCPFFNRHFTTNHTRISKQLEQMTKQAANFEGKILLLSQRYERDKNPTFEKVTRNAANHLGAEITGLGTFRPEFLAFPGGEHSQHFGMVKDWVKDEKPIIAISGCCLNATKDKEGIVSRLSEEVLDLLARTIKAAFDGLPIKEWYIYTFGPDDFKWLGELGISKVLLPYMWDAPLDKVLADMHLNLELTKGLGWRIQQAVDFPVKVGQLSDHVPEADISWLINEAHRRARIMLPKLMENPPQIFSQMKTEQDMFDRIQQEAFLYLVDTITWGQKTGEDRPAVVCAGLEVHGGYWQYGKLFEGPNGEFLPLSWFPQCVRQHWGEWTLDDPRLKKERQRLDFLLKACGY